MNIDHNVVIQKLYGKPSNMIWLHSTSKIIQKTNTNES